MTRDILRSMDEPAGEGSGPCPPHKIRGGLTLNSTTNWGPLGAVGEILNGNFDFNFECICGTSTLIPLPTSVLKGVLRKFLKSKGGEWILRFLKKMGSGAARKAKERLLAELRKKVAAARDKFNRTAAAFREVAAIRLELEKQTLRLLELNKRLDFLKSGKGPIKARMKLFRDSGCLDIGPDAGDIDA